PPRSDAKPWQSLLCTWGTRRPEKPARARKTQSRPLPASVWEHSLPGAGKELLRRGEQPPGTGCHPPAPECREPQFATHLHGRKVLAGKQRFLQKESVSFRRQLLPVSPWQRGRKTRAGPFMLSLPHEALEQLSQPA